MAKKFYTLTEAANSLGISRNAVHQAIKQKRLKAKRGKFKVERTITRTVTGWIIEATELKKYRVSDMHVWVGKKID